METDGLTLGQVLGIRIHLHPSWFILFFLLWWTLGAGVFNASTPGLGPAAHATMGLAATLLFFVSIVAHELAHSLVARTRGIQVDRITLFIFGGIAHTAIEPESPDDELVIAGAGPLLSVVLGVALYGLASAGAALEWRPSVLAVARYLGFINVALALFNLLPGFPLDGGRVFRAIVWRFTGDLGKATRWATAGGSWTGLVMIGLGFYTVIAGGLLSGVWLVVIGLFLRGAAQASANQYEIERVLADTPVRTVMGPAPEVVSGGMTVDEWARGPVMRSRESTFPVDDGGVIAGVVELGLLREIPRERWRVTSVREAMEALDQTNVVGPEVGTKHVLDRARAAGTDEMLVMDDGHVLGLVSRADILSRAHRALLVGGQAPSEHIDPDARHPS